MSDLQATDLMWFADTVGDILLLFFYRDCSFSSDAFITFLSCNKIVQNFCVLYCHSAVAGIWLRRLMFQRLDKFLQALSRVIFSLLSGL